MEHQYTSDERRNRFSSSGADTPRSASQPPTTNGEGFYVSPAMQIYGSPGGRNINPNTNSFNSPWAISSGRVPQALSRSSSIGMPASLPRSSSFSATADRYGSGSFASAIRESHSFPSTFEDDESEALSDATGEYTTDFSYSESRGRNAYLVPDTRSRSQSLATATAMRPGPIGSPPSGWTPGSGPLSIPGRYGYSDVKAPGSRFGSLGNLARSPVGVHGASPSPTGLRVGHGHAELTNISPLARDVGHVMIDEEWGGGDGLDSGATSRRHSVSIIQQPRRGIVGFNAPDSQGQEDGSQNYYLGNSAGTNIGNGGSLYSDDELAISLNTLSLNQQNQSSRSSQPVSQPSSLPIFTPLSRMSHDTISGSLAESLSVPSGEHLPRRMLRSPSESGYSVSSSGTTPPRDVEHSPALDQYSSRTQPSRPEIRTDLSPSMQNLRYNGMQFNIPENGPAPQMSPTFMRSPTAPNQSFMHLHQGQLPLSPTRHLDNQLQMQQILQQQQIGGSATLQRRASQSESLHQHSLSSPSLQTSGQSQLAELGRGIPLHAVPTHWALYIVEFKAGRTDLYYNDDPRMPPLRVNDYVIVEADRGKDLGKIVNDTITAAEVEAFVRQQAAQAQQAALVEQGFGGGPTSPDGHVTHTKREINPKKIYGKATAQDAQYVLFLSVLHPD